MCSINSNSLWHWGEGLFIQTGNRNVLLEKAIFWQYRDPNATALNTSTEGISLEHTSAGVDGGGAKGFPYDGLTDVGGDEERDTRAQAISFLKQLIQQQHNESGHKQLQQAKGDNHVSMGL